MTGDKPTTAELIEQVNTLPRHNANSCQHLGLLRALAERLEWTAEQLKAVGIINAENAEVTKAFERRAVRAEEMLEESEKARIELVLLHAKQTVAPLVERELAVERIPQGLMEMRLDGPAKGMDQQETFRWLVERSNRVEALEAKLAALTAPMEEAVGLLERWYADESPYIDTRVFLARSEIAGEEAGGMSHRPE